MTKRTILSAHAAQIVADRHHCSVDAAWLRYAAEIGAVIEQLEHKTAETDLREPDPFTSRQHESDFER